MITVLLWIVAMIPAFFMVVTFMRMEKMKSNAFLYNYDPDINSEDVMFAIAFAVMWPVIYLIFVVILLRKYVWKRMPKMCKYFNVPLYLTFIADSFARWFMPYLTVEEYKNKGEERADT